VSGCSGVLLCSILALSLTPAAAPAQRQTVVPVTFPAGDPAEGKRVFAERLCTACHRVSDDPDYRTRGALMEGPDLAMSSKKSIGFLATAIITPSHQIAGDASEDDGGERFIDDEGNSLMPSINESLTVAELIDLLAYLTSEADTPLN
jgi:mono/diheme cytochrome c family protein